MFGIDASPFERLLDLREDKIKPKELDPAALLGPYLKEISVVIDAKYTELAVRVLHEAFIGKQGNL